MSRSPLSRAVDVAFLIGAGLWAVLLVIEIVRIVTH